jgi:hypothetical protein
MRKPEMTKKTRTPVWAKGRVPRPFTIGVTAEGKPRVPVRWPSSTAAIESARSPSRDGMRRSVVVMRPASAKATLRIKLA